jgi:hypothetical protein
VGDENRYFPGDAAPELRVRLDAYLAGLGERLGASAFAGEVAFMLLGGGYGRGEGGVYREADGRLSLYNDLEFYLVLKSGAGQAAAAQWCGEESHIGEHETGIEVEFKILTLAALSGAEPSMFYYDLLAANRLIFGDAGLVAALPAKLRDAVLIPAHEATRLLFNRGSGLYYARLRLAEAEPDKAFIERNHAKARLAFGDAVVAMNRRYTWSCRERHTALMDGLATRPAQFERLVEWHAAAVEFKFHPVHESPPVEMLRERQWELQEAWRELFLWTESMRLGRKFQSVEEYAGYKGRLLPEFPMPRNVALHLRDRLRRGKPPGGLLDYPRAPLQRALALLLKEGGDLNAVRRVLGLPENASGAEILQTYRKWWGFYN